MATKAEQATEALKRIRELKRKLDFWEKDLRANYETHRARGESSMHTMQKIQAELSMIESVRDIITPGWSD